MAGVGGGGKGLVWVTGMDFGSEMLSVDHADISKRDIGNNRCISWTKQKFLQRQDCVCEFISYLY
jgi:hypothetical protein